MLCLHLANISLEEQSQTILSVQHWKLFRCSGSMEITHLFIWFKGLQRTCFEAAFLKIQNNF